MSGSSYTERAAAKRQRMADQRRLKRWSERRNLLLGWMLVWLVVFLVWFAFTIPI